MIRPPTEKTTLTEYDRQLVHGIPFLLGKELEFSTSAVATVQKIPHGLGRAYRGMWVIWTSGARPELRPPASQTDADLNLAIQDASGTASSVKAWVW